MDAFLQITKLHLRLTTDKPMDEVLTFVKQFTTTYLISQEDPGKHQHYHILLQYQNLDDAKHSKLRYALQKTFGKGNGIYSISTVRNHKQLMKYILKDDGVMEKSNIPDQVIELMKKCSNKKGKKNFASDLSLLEERLLSKSITLKQFQREFIQLKVSYGQNLYPNHIRSYLYKMAIKNDNNYIDYFINEFIKI